MDATLLLRGAWVGVGWDVNVHLHVHTTWMLRCCYVGHGLGWGGMLTFICTCTPRGCYVAAAWGMGWAVVEWDVNVHLHVHTTWMLRCCYVGHGLGWGGMLTFICTCTPRGCYVAATWGMGWGGVGWDVNVHLQL